MLALHHSELRNATYETPTSIFLEIVSGYKLATMCLLTNWIVWTRRRNFKIYLNDPTECWAKPTNYLQAAYEAWWTHYGWQRWSCQCNYRCLPAITHVSFTRRFSEQERELEHFDYSVRFWTIMQSITNKFSSIQTVVSTMMLRASLAISCVKKKFSYVFLAWVEHCRFGRTGNGKWVPRKIRTNYVSKYQPISYWATLHRFE